MNKKSKLWISLGLATAVAVSAGSAFAASSSTPDNQPSAQHQKHQHDKMGWEAGMKNNQQLLDLLKVDAATLQNDLKSGKSLADIAAAKGVSEQQVIDLLVKQQTQRIDQAVQAGKVTSDKASQFKAKLPERVKQMVEQKGLFKEHKGQKAHKGHYGNFGHLNEAASVLGMTPKDLMTQLKSGKSIKDIAQAKGISEQQVIDALLQKDKERITNFVEKSDWTHKDKSGSNQNQSPQAN